MTEQQLNESITDKFVMIYIYLSCLERTQKTEARKFSKKAFELWYDFICKFGEPPMPTSLNEKLRELNNQSKQWSINK